MTFFIRKPTVKYSPSIAKRRCAIALVLTALLIVIEVMMTLLPINSHHAPTRAFSINLARYGKPGDEVTCEIVVTDGNGWEERRAKAIDQAKTQIRSFDTAGRFFFQNNWNPTVACELERRLGLDDGGKWVCNPDRMVRPVLVYSMGSNNNFAFEEAAHEAFGPDTEIHTFDFGRPSGVPPFVKYHRYKIGAADDGDGVRSLKSIVDELGHEGRVIDILKMDIEGHEYAALMAALREGVFQNVHQLQIEVHMMRGAFRTMTSLTPNQLHELFIALNDADMEIFHKEPNTSGSRGDACEFSFVKVVWR